MKIIYTDNIPVEMRLNKLFGHLIYNAFDCLVTKEVWDALRPMVDADAYATHTYNFTFRQQVPALIMSRRGIRVDQAARVEMLAELERAWTQQVVLLNKLTDALVGRSIMAKKEPSKEQMKVLLYKVLGLPVQTIKDKVTKEVKVTVNRDALEKLQEFLLPRPIISTILAIRDTNKKRSVLASGIDADSRMRVTYSVSGTGTGRWSSYENVRGGGTNGQNLTDKIRRIFIPSPGLKLGNVDLKQAEAKCVAYLSGDENYINACTSGDIHTYVARDCFPNYPWTRDDKADRKLADLTKVYRHFSLRDMAKRGAHQTNYYAKPYSLHKTIKIPMSIAEDFQARYFTAFPGIHSYHLECQRELISSGGVLITPTGRKILFFGHPQSDETLKAYVAVSAQSLSGDILNMGLCDLVELDEIYGLTTFSKWKFHLLAQIHDAVLYEFDPRYEGEVHEAVKAKITRPITVRERTMTLLPDVSSGWNWGKYVNDEKNGDFNLHGLRDWTGADDRNAPAERRPTAEQLLSLRVC